MSGDRLRHGWTSAALGEVMDPFTTKVDPQTQPDAPFIGMEHVEAQAMRLIETAYCRDFKSAANSFKPGQVLYGRLRPYLNKVLVPEFAGACSGELLVLEPTQAIRPRYLAYLLNHQSFVAFAGTLDTGDRPRVKYDQIATYEFALPPTDEQDLIIELLDTGLQGVHGSMVDMAQAAELVTQMRTSALQALADPSFPEKRIGDLGDVFVGATPRRSEPNLWGGGIPWVSSGEVAFCRISATRETITDAGLGNRDRRLHPPGTVMLAMIGEGKTRGQAAILDIAAAHNQNSAAIRLDPNQMRPEFLYLALMRQYDLTRKFSRGGQQPALNKALVEDIKVPCPLVDTQDVLIERAQHQLAVCAEQAAALATTQQLARAARTALLRDALAGRLTPRVDGVLPANHAVAEVRAERATHPAKKRRRRPIAAL
jgi:type I restriction enzyme S subunit